MEFHKMCYLLLAEIEGNENSGLLNSTDDDRRSCRMPRPQVSMGTQHRHIIINNGLNPFIDIFSQNANV